MKSRALAALVAVSLLTLPAYADNAMGYRLLSAEDAARLPNNQGALGLQVSRSQRMIDDGMVFDIIRVTNVKSGSAGARAGLKAGDNIIALDGKVFPTLDAFSAYISAARPGTQITVDYIPAKAGPQQAQRVAIKVGKAGQTASSGMSTGTKVAIGAGAVALLGCYEMGCFSRSPKAVADPDQQPNGMQPNRMQQPNGMQPYGMQQQNGMQQPNGMQPYGMQQQ